MEVAIRKEELYFMSEKGKRIYTIEDIEALPEGQRAELLDGKCTCWHALQQHINYF